MNTPRFIHQQVMQLKCHFWACLGLVMALPVEEAFMHFKEGDGFYCQGMPLLSALIAPFLAALLACATVQADLDVRRESFWQSKPVTVARFMTGKYFIGLLMVIVTLVFPLLFSWITLILADEMLWRGIVLLFVMAGLFCWLAYSICFFVNVLIRNTAQAWLIGVAVTILALLASVILPLNVKDLSTDLFDGPMKIILITVALVFSCVAFIGSILAVKHNWRVHTHLRGLLWGGAGLVFMVVLFFSHQVANIKILDVKTVVNHEGEVYDYLHSQLGAVFLDGSPTYYKVSVDNGTIDVKSTTLTSQQFEELRQRAHAPESYEVPEELKRTYDYAWAVGQSERNLPSLYRVGQSEYWFRLNSYYRTEEEVVDSTGTRGNVIKVKEHRHYERAYLQCSRPLELGWEPVSYLDLSEYLQDSNDLAYGEREWRATVCLIKDRAIVVLNKHCLLVDISNPKEMVVVESQPLKYRLRYEQAKSGFFDLLPLESLDRNDRIKASISLAALGGSVFTGSDGSVRYVLCGRSKILLYEVEEIKADQIRCRLRDERRASPLEEMGNPWINKQILKDGVLYLCFEHRLMVFDISGSRIRKLGHFERWNESFQIGDMEVLENGNILLAIGNTRNSVHLQLLQNPK